MKNLNVLLLFHLTDVLPSFEARYCCCGQDIRFLGRRSTTETHTKLFPRNFPNKHDLWPKPDQDRVVKSDFDEGKSA
jgi:hypothetical protein